MAKGKRQIAQPPILNRVPTAVDLQGAIDRVAEEALGTMVTIMRTGEVEKNRLSAAQRIFEYAKGKPEQNVTMNGNMRLEILTQEQRDAAMQAMLYGDGE